MCPDPLSERRHRKAGVLLINSRFDISAHKNAAGKFNWQQPISFDSNEIAF